MKKQIIIVSVLLLAGIGQAIGQNKIITGVVTLSRSGEPLPGVSILVHRTTTGTVSDDHGLFTIIAPQNACTLDLSYIGMKQKSIDIDGSDVQHHIITMETNILKMGELFIAYDTLTGNISRYLVSAKSDTIHFK